MSQRSQRSQRLKGKVAIVTGASSGLGRAIALRYAEEGANIVCADLNLSPQSAIPGSPKATHDMINERGGESIGVKVDVCDSGSVQDMVEATVNEFGRVDM